MAFSAGAGAGANLGSASGEIRIDTAAAERNLKQLQGSVGAFASSTDSSFRRIVTGVGLLSFGAGVFRGLTAGVGAARDFEQAIANVNAVTDLTAGQLDQVRQAALKLGADSVFSATEAANAMEELAKAGVSVEDILNGAAQGAVALAASAGIGLPQAATIIATAMNTFNLSGDQATHVADVFSAAANKSAADADGLAQSLQQVGLVAATNNITLEETTGILALLADNGLKGSDAGTALKTAIQSLLTPMGRGADEMAKYGINVRDANDNFIGFAATADELHRALDPLPKAQRDAALAAIFGTDAIRVGNVLWREGADTITEYTNAVNDSGAAQETAAKRLNTFNGAVEQLRGALETAAIIIGKKFLPPLKLVVQALTAVVQAFVALPGPVQTMLAGLVAASGVIAGLAGVLVLAGPKLAAFGEALKVIRTALLGFAAANPIVLALVAALALFGLAYKTNFGGFADAVNGAIDKVREFGDVFARSFAFSRSLPEIGNLGAAFAAVGQAMTEVLGIDVYKQFRVIGKVADRIGKSLNRMSRQFGVLSRAIKRGGLAEGFDQLFGKVGQKLLAEFGDAIGALPRTVGTALRQIKTGFGPLDAFFKNLGSGFIQFGRFIENIFAGNFETAWENGKNALTRLAKAGINLGTIAVSIADWLVDAAQDLWTAITRKIAELLGLTAFDVGGGNGQILNPDKPVPLGILAVAITDWAVKELKSLAARVGEFITDEAWPRAKRIVTRVFGAAVAIGSWIVSGAADLFPKVAAFITDTAWPAVQRAVSGGLSLVLPVGTLVFNAGVDVAGELRDVARDFGAWFVKKYFTDRRVTVGEVQADGSIVVTVRNEPSIAERILQSIIHAIASATNWIADIGDAIANKFLSGDIFRAVSGISFTGGEGVGVAIRNAIAKAIDLMTLDNLVDAGKLAIKVGKAIALGFTASVLAIPVVTGIILGALISFLGGVVKGLVFGPDDIDWSAAITSFVATFVSAIAAIPKQLGDAIRSLFSSGSTVFKRGLGGGRFVTTETKGMFSDLVDALKLPDIPTPKLPDWLTNTGWLTGPITKLTNAINTAIGPLKKAWDTYKSIKDFFSGEGVDTEQAAKDLMNLEARSRPGGGGAGHGGGFKMRPFLDSGIQMGETIGRGVMIGITNKKADVTAALRSLAELGSGGGAPRTTPKAPETPKQVKLPAPDLSALLKGLADAVKATQSGMADIIEATADVVGPLAKAGHDAAQSFAAGISAGMRIAIGAAATGALQVVNAARANLGTLGPAGFSVGQSLGFGIANGIASTIGAVINAAVNLVAGAVNAARAYAQIASPSRLFAEKVGLPIAQGMAVGINDGGRTVQRSIADLISGALPSVSTSRMLGGQSVSRGGGPTIIYQTVITPLKSDEYLALIEKAERGHNAETTWENLPRSHNLVFGLG